MRTTIITPTTGDSNLRDCCESVARQTMNAVHLVVADGPDAVPEALRITAEVADENNMYRYAIMSLPWNVGANGHYGHRVYAGVPSFVETEFFSFLDQDNMIDKDFVRQMERAMDRNDEAQYATCRRKVVRQDGKVIGLDNKESIGENQLGYRLYDTNTWILRTGMSLLTPYISIPFHIQEDGSWGGDRSFTQAVWKVPHVHVDNYHGAIYRAPERLYKFFEEICDAE